MNPDDLSFGAPEPLTTEQAAEIRPEVAHDDVIYQALSELAGLDASDTNLRDRPRSRCHRGVEAMSAKHYIVVFDDEMSACCPMGWDKDCEGALSAMTDGTVALFDSKPAARKAIRVSTAFAKLRIAQGLPANVDFLGWLKFVKVVSCVSAQRDGGA